MQRRRAGMGVIGLVLLAAVVAPNVLPRSLVGAAVAEPVLAPPLIGQCLLVPMATLGLADQPSETLAAQFGPCSGRRLGEVVTVLPTLPQYTDETADTAAERVCLEASIGYAGLPPTTTDQPWDIEVPVVSVRSGPTLRQRAAGQQWTACTASIGAAGLTGTLRNAFPYPSRRDADGVCLPAADWTGQDRAACSANHMSELLGRMSLPEGSVLDADRIEQSCLTLARTLTLMPDPTAAGQLVVETASDHLLTTGEVVSGLGTPGFSVCAIRAQYPRRLTGSLIGLGSAPVPWA